MKITRTSMLSGITRTMDLPVTQKDYDAWENGALIQHAMPYLSEDDREFILTGITADEWDETMTEWESEDLTGYEGYD